MKRRNFLKTGLAAIAGTSTTAPARAMARDCRETANATVASSVTHDEVERQAIGWGWKDVPHGPVLASDVLGQLVDGDPSRPHFGSYGPNGGPNDHGFFLYAAMGRTDTTLGLAAHAGIGKLAVPDCWNHRVLLFDLHADGSLATRRSTALIGQARYDVMEIASGADRLHYPTACAFDPAGQFLFVADQHNHRVLQFAMSAPSSPIRVYGQPDFESWGYDATRGDATRVLRDSLRSLYGGDGPFHLPRRPSDRGLFLPCGLVSDGKRLFVSDCDNHRVLVFDTAGTGNGPAALAVLGQRDFHEYRPNRGGVAGPDKPLNASADRKGLENFYGTPGPDTMMFPTGLAVDRSGRYLLVADCLNYRLLVFDVGGEIRNGMPAIAVIPAPLTKQKSPPTRPTDRDFVGIVDVIVDERDRVFVSEREGLRVLVYRLQDILGGNPQPQAAVGRFEMMTDLDQVKGLGKAEGPTALAVAGRFLYVAEPRGSRVLCYDASDPGRRAVKRTWPILRRQSRPASLQQVRPQRWPRSVRLQLHRRIARAVGYGGWPVAARRRLGRRPPALLPTRDRRPAAGSLCALCPRRDDADVAGEQLRRGAILAAKSQRHDQGRRAVRIGLRWVPRAVLRTTGSRRGFR